MGSILPSLIIVKRELLTSLRRTRTLLFVVALLLAAGSVVLLSWPSGNVPSTYVAGVSKQMLFSVSITLFLGCILFVPGIAAYTIVSEREQDTLDALYLTLVRPSGVVSAKVMNTVGIYLLLIVGTFPVFATVMFGVGLDWSELAAILGLLIGTAACCAMIGVLCSCLFRRTFIALVVAYASTIGLLCGPWYFLLILRVILTGQIFYLFNYVGRSIGRADWSTVFSPLHMLLGIQSQSLSAWQLPATLLIQAVFCLVCFFMSVRFLRRPAQPRAVSGEKTIEDPAVLHARRTRFPYYLVDPLRRKPMIEDGKNPMRVREVRWGLFNRGTVLIRIFYSVFTVCLFASLFLSIGSGRSVQIPIMTWLTIENVLIMLVICGLTANSFAKEYELGNMDMLRMTLLRPTSIVAGKISGSFTSLVPIALALAIGSLPMAIIQWSSAWVLIPGFITLTVCAALTTSASILTSLIARRTNAALMGGVALSAYLLLGNFAIIGVGYIILRDTWPLPRVKEEAFFYLSPLLSFPAAFADRNPHAVAWGVTQTIFLAIAGLLVAATITFLKYRRMRDP
ncbi:MAG: ABC transporter permease [Candidatus Hydrogenedentes bacterium]|nr:ABC transporter permease [Candidatus Hydrogenedentota bacterium]